MEINKNMIISGDKAPEIEIRKFNNSTYIVVPFILSKQPLYEWIELVFKPFNYNYGSVIDSIIGLKYSLSETLAILNNYLSDPENVKYVAEFNELQEWRRTAKEYVKKHLKFE